MGSVPRPWSTSGDGGPGSKTSGTLFHKLSRPGPALRLMQGETGDNGAGPGREYPGTPRWVKVFVIAIIAVVLLVVVIILLGHRSPVQHGP